MDLKTIQDQLIETLPLGADLALQALKTHIPAFSNKYDDLILLESRYRELNQHLLRGTMTKDELQVEFNRLREAILEFIHALEETDFQEAPAQTSAQKGFGKLLYRIPDQMEFQKEEKCIVRIAFDEVLLLEGLETQEEDVVKQIRIAEVMGAELIDPNEDKAFAIRTFSEPIQFIDEAAFTEWIFFVKPLLVGRYSLLLKIAVVEILDGKERKREVVLEESVEIITEPITLKAEIPLKTSNFQIATAQTSAPAPGYPFAPVPTPAPAPAPKSDTFPGFPKPSTIFQPHAPQPAPPTRTVRTNARKKLGGAAAVALASVMMAILAVVIIQPWNAAAPGNNDGPPDFVVGPEGPSRPTLDTAVAPSDPAEDSLNLKSTNIAQTEKPAPNKTGPEAPKDRSEDRNSAKTPAIHAIKKAPDAPAKPDIPAPEPEKIIPFNSAAREPVYKGCPLNNPAKARDCFDTRLARYIKSNLHMPEEAVKNGKEGTVTVTFIIEKDGSVTLEKIDDQIGFGCEEEAARLVSQLPRFIPGQNAFGDPIRVRYILPIRFQL